MARRLLLGLEARLRSKVALQSPMIQLIIRHPAFVFTRYRVGQDGRTVYKRFAGWWAATGAAAWRNSANR